MSASHQRIGHADSVNRSLLEGGTRLHKSFCRLWQVISVLSPDGSVIAATDLNDCQFFSTGSGGILSTIALSWCRQIRWSPDSTLIGFVFNDRSQITIDDYPSMEEVHRIEKP